MNERMKVRKKRRENEEQLQINEQPLNLTQKWIKLRKQTK